SAGKAEAQILSESGPKPLLSLPICKRRLINIEPDQHDASETTRGLNEDRRLFAFIRRRCDFRRHQYVDAGLRLQKSQFDRMGGFTTPWFILQDAGIPR